MSFSEKLKTNNKACVIGHPISHSLSPIIHNHWLQKYNIEGEYKAADVAPHELEEFLSNLTENGYRGCNITIPHKENAWKIISQSDKYQNNNSLPAQIAKFMEAVNTVVIDRETGEYLATNTDFIGYARSLIEAEPEFDYRNAIAFVLGAGGAAKAVIFALFSMNVGHIVVCNRTHDKALEIERIMRNSFQLGDDKISVVKWENRNEAVKHCNIFVNTTSLGMNKDGVAQGEVDVDISQMSKPAIVSDIIYNPLKTALLERAEKSGLSAVNGLGMLMHQAAPAFEGWYGKKPEVDEELRKKLLSNFGG